MGVLEFQIRYKASSPPTGTYFYSLGFLEGWVL